MPEVIRAHKAEGSGNIPAEIPERVDHEAVLAFIHAFMSEGLTITDAALKVGVTDRTVRNWRASEWWPTAMLAAEAQLRDEYLGAALSTLLAATRGGSVKAATALATHIITLNRHAPVRKGPLDRRHGVAAIPSAGGVQTMPDADLRRLVNQGEDE